MAKRQKRGKGNAADQMRWDDEEVTIEDWVRGVDALIEEIAMPVDFEDFKRFRAQVEQLNPQRRRQSREADDRLLQQTLRELVVHPLWQPFVDRVEAMKQAAVGNMHAIESSMFDADTPLGSEDWAKARMRHMYLAGIAKGLSDILGVVQEMTKNEEINGEDAIPTG